jgi:hypothetical protein
MVFSAFTKVDCPTLVQHMKMSVMSLNIAQKKYLAHMEGSVLSFLKAE